MLTRDLLWVYKLIRTYGILLRARRLLSRARMFQQMALDHGDLDIIRDANEAVQEATLVLQRVEDFRAER